MRIHPALLLLFVLPIACATVDRGPTQDIRLESEPPGATVVVRNCGYVAPESVVTPATIRVNRRVTECSLTFEYGDYSPRTVHLERHVEASEYKEAMGSLCGPNIEDCNSFEDVVLMGFIGTITILPSFVVDSASGAIFEQRPDFVAVKFDDQ